KSLRIILHMLKDLIADYYVECVVLERNAIIIHIHDTKEIFAIADKMFLLAALRCLVAIGVDINTICFDTLLPEIVDDPALATAEIEHARLCGDIYIEIFEYILKEIHLHPGIF